MKTTRNTSVDAVRTAALIGICVVNLPFLALPPEQAMGQPAAQVDRFAAFLVELLFQGKFFLLFSFIFGWGVQIQIVSAARAGVSFGSRYFRRLAGLALLGCLHAVLVFPGDILLIYAMLALMLWPFRSLGPNQLLPIAGAMIGVGLIGLGALAVMLSTSTTMPIAHSLGGGIAEATRARLADWPETLSFLFLFQGPLAFGAFLLGLAAAKSDFFAPESRGRRKLARAMPWLLLIALPANLLFSLAPQDNSPLELAGLLAFAIGAPALSAIYLHLLLWLDAYVRLPGLLVDAGRNSLTAYVLQGVIAGAVFGGYGLGLFGAFGHAGLFLLAVGLALVSMILTGLMARLWGRAPLESLLRRVTYGDPASRPGGCGKSHG